MSGRALVVPNRYLDSVALLRIAAELRVLEGVSFATAVMATPSNVEAVREVGVDVLQPVTPADVLVAVTGNDDAIEAALAHADALLRARPPRGSGEARAEEAPRTFAQYRRRHGAPDVVLVSVPGPYAATEAAKAVDAGSNVMIFSDNVSLDDEVALKRAAAAKDLLVMGPDCGTSIVNGVPLGFANVVRRGAIAVIGASGTGMQEVTSRIHRLGGGVSQAVGCGGRDLAAEVGGVTMRTALRLLANDPATEVVVLVSKPPSPVVLADVLVAARAAHEAGKRVVGCFVGADPALLDGTGVVAATSLADAADRAVAIVTGKAASPVEPEPVSARTSGSVVRGAFVGGTFCHEAERLLEHAGVAHELVDFGDDEYTFGRPHPMIDPAVRDAWLLGALDDPTTSLVLFDVVLGHGAHLDPTGDLVRSLALRGRRDDDAPLVAHVCGTELDPQGREGIVASLRRVGVHVADSNRDAALAAAKAAFP